MEYPKRKSNRLKEFSYSQTGYYFITICTKNRQKILSDIVGADIIRPQLLRCGEIADKTIKAIPSHYANTQIIKYVIMPDHIHLILRILNEENGRIISAPTTVMSVIGQMKRLISKEMGSSVWQHSFYDHIIRDEQDYIMHLNYIEQNPIKWLCCDEREPDEEDCMPEKGNING